MLTRIRNRQSETHFRKNPA